MVSETSDRQSLAKAEQTASVTCSEVKLSLSARSASFRQEGRMGRVLWGPSLIATSDVILDTPES